MRHKQDCSCGYDGFNIQVVTREGGNLFLASCAECGRVTGSVGDGSQYRGMNIKHVPGVDQ